jgi:leucyl/phenylalanyl-tRNA--protein transferase
VFVRWLQFGRDEPWNIGAADANGLVAVGGDLRPERLIAAYRAGVFPWYAEGDPICWWSPDPRAVFDLGGFHLSRRLQRTIRSGRYQVTVNRAFAAVMRGCAVRTEGTWITAEMLEAYGELHRLGFAHSVETYCDGELAGGLYGVAIGGFFAGESMFARRRDASKVALAFTVQRLRERGFTLFDTQFRTPHTTRLGAMDVSRELYLNRLALAVNGAARFG